MIAKIHKGSALEKLSQIALVCPHKEITIDTIVTIKTKEIFNIYFQVCLYAYIPINVYMHFIVGQEIEF